MDICIVINISIQIYGYIYIEKSLPLERKFMYNTIHSLQLVICVDIYMKSSIYSANVMKSSIERNERK